MLLSMVYPEQSKRRFQPTVDAGIIPPDLKQHQTRISSDSGCKNDQKVEFRVTVQTYQNNIELQDKN